MFSAEYYVGKQNGENSVHRDQLREFVTGQLLVCLGQRKQTVLYVAVVIDLAFTSLRDGDHYHACFRGTDPWILESTKRTHLVSQGCPTFCIEFNEWCYFLIELSY